nr:hypothetical protein KitaXyl93_51280 [Kitasatospora sp. Xyl93]
MAGGGSAAGYSVEIEPEVREWLQQCSLPEYRAVERAADRLTEDGELLPFPLSSHLGGGLRELRVGPVRITTTRSTTGRSSGEQWLSHAVGRATGAPRE